MTPDDFPQPYRDLAAYAAVIGIGIAAAFKLWFDGRRVNRADRKDERAEDAEQTLFDSYKTALQTLRSEHDAWTTSMRGEINRLTQGLAVVTDQLRLAQIDRHAMEIENNEFRERMRHLEGCEAENRKLKERVAHLEAELERVQRKLDGV